MRQPKNNIQLSLPKPPKVTFPSEHIGNQFSKQMHPSNVASSLHNYYEADREDDFITKHPFGISSETV